MKANEFIKKYGVEEAKKVLHCMDDASEFTTHMPGDDWDKPTLIDAVGLRRLVESHELVESCGGMEAAIIEANSCRYFEYGELSERAYRIMHAIADVESCHVG